jgi:hypothetical protein
LADPTFGFVPIVIAFFIIFTTISFVVTIKQTGKKKKETNDYFKEQHSKTTLPKDSKKEDMKS